MTRVRLRGGSTEDLAFDPETLRERYRRERDRRVRADGNAQLSLDR